MAATSLTSSPLATHDSLLIRPLTGRIPSLRPHSHHRRRALPIVLRSAPEARPAVTEAEREDGDLFRKKLDAYSQNGNGNGYASANGSAEVLLKGNGAANGSLVKYVGGNEAATAEVVGEVTEERKRKKRVEDIGRQDAWFRTSGSTPQIGRDFQEYSST